MAQAKSTAERSAGKAGLDPASLASAVRVSAEEGSHITLARHSGVPPEGFNGLGGAELTVIEELVEEMFPCRVKGDRLSVIHIEGLTFERVSRTEALLYREDRAAKEKTPPVPVPECLAKAIKDSDVRRALDRTVLLPGRGSEQLASEIAPLLKVSVVPTSKGKFSSSESFALIEKSIRGCHAVVVQQVVDDADHAVASMELLLDATSRASAQSIQLLMPYLPYQRQERRGMNRSAVTPALFFNKLANAGRGRLDTIITVDMHTLAAEGMSGNINVDNLSGAPLFLPRLSALVGNREVAVVFPDAGARKRAKEDQLEAKIRALWPGRVRFGTMNKDRDKTPGVIKESTFEGDPSIIHGRVVIMFDDLIDTGGTARTGMQELWHLEPADLMFAATHPLNRELAVEKFRTFTVESQGRARRAVSKILVGNSVPLRRGAGDLIEQVDFNPMLAHFLAGVVSEGGFSTRELALLYSGVARAEK